MSGLSGLVCSALSMAGEAWTEVVTTARKPGNTERKRCPPPVLSGLSGLAEALLAWQVTLARACGVLMAL